MSHMWPFTEKGHVHMGHICEVDTKVPSLTQVPYFQHIYGTHTGNVCDKVKSRCNIISKLAGTDWGSPAPVLSTSAIALEYSVAEYCVPVWGRCAHVQHVDTQLNIAMRSVSGAVRPTNINWLPVLNNIEPPQIPRDRATLQEYKKAQELTDRVPI